MMAFCYRIGNKADEYEENLFDCPCCGETWSKNDSTVEKVGDDWLCPRCYRDRYERVKRIVRGLDEWEIELMYREVK